MPVPVLAAKFRTASSPTSRNFSNSGKDSRPVGRFPIDDCAEMDRCGRRVGLSRRRCHAVFQAARNAVSDSAGRTHGSGRRRPSRGRRARADDRRRRKGHRLARAGKAGPARLFCSSTAMAISSPAASAAFASLTSDGTGLVALSFRGYAGSTGSPSEAGAFEGCGGGLCLHGRALRCATGSCHGVSRLGHGVAVAVASEASGRKIDSGGALHVDGRRCRRLCFPSLLSVC